MGATAQLRLVIVIAGRVSCPKLPSSQAVNLCDIILPMPTIGPEQTRLLAQLANTQREFVDAEERRRRAIIAAVEGGVGLREVSKAAQCSHEKVRRIVAADGAVTLELDGQEYRLTEKQVEILIYKLDGMATGAFPGDLQLLAAGGDWLPAAGDLAADLQRAQADEEGAPVAVTEARGFALFQILRLTYFGGESVFSAIFQTLLARYGQPHVLTGARVRTL
jgi:hypothetical protein